VGVNRATRLVELITSPPTRYLSIYTGWTEPTVSNHLRIPYRAALVAGSISGRRVLHREAELTRFRAGYQIHPFSRAIRYASARDPASSFCVIVAR
jgi:hypothetical protein